jgi:DNA-binding MarR family transcriptional regulator
MPLSSDIGKLARVLVQMRLLSAIDAFQPIAQTRLADLFDVAGASVSVMVVRMESAGLIERKPDQTDRRVLLVSLTPKGLEAVKVGKTVWDEIEAKVLTSLDGLNPDQAATLLRAIRNGFGGSDPETRILPAPKPETK